MTGAPEYQLSLITLPESPAEKEAETIRRLKQESERSVQRENQGKQIQVAVRSRLDDIPDENMKQASLMVNMFGTVVTIWGEFIGPKEYGPDWEMYE